jgi:hypothetical protein
MESFVIFKRGIFESPGKNQFGKSDGRGEWPAAPDHVGKENSIPPRRRTTDSREGAKERPYPLPLAIPGAFHVACPYRIFILKSENSGAAGESHAGEP